MNKKGFLLAEETLKIILGVIAIGFLAYLLISLYFSAKTSQGLEQAKVTLPFLMNQISTGKTSVDIYNPKGWSLGIWPHVVNTEFLLFSTGSSIERPQLCSNLGLSSCICLCPSDSADSCDNKGVCVDNKEYLIPGSSIILDNPPVTLTIDNKNKIINIK